MIHPLLQRQENIIPERHYDSEDYIFGVEISPIKGIFQPKLEGEKKELLLSLPIEYFQSIVNEKHLEKKQYFFDNYPCFISCYNSLCLFSGSSIPIEHTTSLVNILYSVFQFNKVITIDTVDTIKTISQLSTSFVEIKSNFPELLPPYTLPKSSAALFTFCEFNHLSCISLILEQEKQQVNQLLSFLELSTPLKDISLPSVSYSFSTLYA
ncbi:hypothetical protein EHI8A_008720 [Entamoeba histolytica HM-1:IMSS-B]|uniref:Uncharacterized protein n=6 Tax=Entamoeba histolytica TaxID=5759 RepID=A0A8U0WPC3_ENTH1|nr:hypothetical protein EHI_170450 [Entamoeba histolytica HM-1:IMSS]EMD48968.1 Hypothetical protein EHI5A_023790 [Entamoeba histolytica KU27]EMH77741.1 hypothetical protein EHI8A_008720 [Entamoeba histolytica HM-1:IMSS-B]EMS14561.1 hypothetical protein KM1_026670 [Entamoeba histolytica HM-3:IMSS]ENY64769.1 hypothetical protein EHI7A_011210 [Entamoeba histolytica HM-1:IMSS-A]CAC34301.1 hypothetical protein [Entamoeba histolytica]|eukprot:XP_651029.1 hypothetical protein EHI_170450 [Entamoeba histolytica HM-1:IMSS]